MSGTNRRGALILWVSVLLIAMIRGPVSADLVGQPGELDTSFAPIGSGLDARVRAIVVQPDGKILIGGDFTTYNGSPAPKVTRLDPDGSRDPRFTQTGFGNTPTVLALALQPDGKILVGGDFTTFNVASAARLVRLNPDGSRDTTFVQSGAGFDSTVTSVVVQPDGKILVGGGFTKYGSAAVSRLVRLNADGSLDTTFAQTGSGLNSYVSSVVLQPDGRILVGGAFTKYGPDDVAYLVRLNSNGSRDVTFTGPTFASGQVQSLIVQPDGRILVGGSFGSPIPFLLRLNIDGSHDPSFAPAGTGLNDMPYSMGLQPDGRVVVGGPFSTPARYLVRFNADGSRDVTFQTGLGPDGWVFAVAGQQDGRILIGGGLRNYDGQTRTHIARLFGAPQPKLSVSAGTLAFGSQPVGAASNPQTVTISNSGTAPLIFGADAVSLSGANSSQFEVTGDTCSGSTVAAAATCTVSVVFAPTSAGAKSGRVNLVSNAGTSPDRVALSGTGTVPGVSLNPTTLAFGNQAVGSTSSARTVTVTNSGAAPLRFEADAVTVGGTNPSQFEVTGDTCSGSTVAAAATCTVSVVFAPTSAAAKSGRVNVMSNAGSSPNSVALSGTGSAVPVPGASLSPASLTFPEQSAGSVSPAQSVTVTNSGAAPLLFGADAVSVSGSDSSQFRVTGDTCSAGSVPVAGTCTVSVVFAPSSAGAKSARVNLVSNAGTSPDRIAVTGSATPAPPPQPTPTVTVNPPPVVVYEPGPTVTATPSSPVKPFDLAATATVKQVSADWAGSDASYRVSVTGTDPKKKSFAKTVTTQKTAVVVKAKIRAKSKVTVCVRAINAVGTSARTCASVKAK